MPNPIESVPGGWLATWALQVMPLFFVVGGYANLAAWQRARESGRGGVQFVGQRLRRLFWPTAAWASVWIAGELIAAAVTSQHRWMWSFFPGFLVPLWFIGVYAAMIALVPITAVLHARWGATALAALVTLIAVGTVLHRGAGLGWVAWLTAAAVWLFCHQLGYCWRSSSLGRRPIMQRAAIAVTGLATLVGLTVLAGFPRSMVATAIAHESNIFPTNAAIAAVAVLQLGLVVLIGPAVLPLLRQQRYWKPVVAVNGVAMTVFLWHMTAYLVVVWIYEGAGGALLAEPTTQWWAQRWLWLLAPLGVLTLLVAVFGRVESAARVRPG